MTSLDFGHHCAEIVAQTSLLTGYLDGADLTVPVGACPGWTATSRWTASTSTAMPVLSTSGSSESVSGEVGSVIVAGRGHFQSAGAGREDGHVGAGAGELELLADDRRLRGAAQPQ